MRHTLENAAAMNGGNAVKRRDITLAVLAASPSGTLGPVQMQKALFLVDKRIPKFVDGPLFNFRPYHYGPFDAEIYRVLEELEAEGAVVIDHDPNVRRNSYRITSDGLERGRSSLAALPAPARGFIERVATFIYNSSFSQLVSSIYREYPEMKENSVFA